MNFLSPMMLWGLIAVAAPILIHLWRRRQVVPLNFSTLRFLKVVAVKTRRSAQLENLFLLLLRCLIVVLLVLAAARPSVTTSLAKYLGGKESRVVVLAIDNSLSMGCLVNGISRLQTSKNQAIAVLDALAETDEVALITASSPSTLIISQPTLDHKLVRQLVESITQSEAVSDVATVFREALQSSSKSGLSRKELYLFTDNQRTAWQFDKTQIDAEAWRKSEFHTLLVLPDSSVPGNGSIENITLTSSMAKEGAILSGRALVWNHSNVPLEQVLEITLAGERLVRKAITLPPNSSRDINFDGTIGQVNSKLLQIVASIEPDNLMPDNLYRTAIRASQTPKVLIVEGQQAGEKRFHSGYYLSKALQAGTEGGDPSVVIDSQALEGTALSSYSAVFLADVASLGDRSLVRLGDYLKSGGTVVLFTGDLSCSGSLERSSLLPILHGDPMDLPPGRLEVGINDRLDPLLSGTWENTDAQFPAMPQRRIASWKPAKNAKVILTYSNGIPFVVSASVGSGTMIAVNASADRSWGDFPLSPAFVPIVQQLANLSAAASTGCITRHVGESIPMLPSIPSDQQLTLIQPDGHRIDIPSGEKASLLEHSKMSGFYTVSIPKEGIIAMVAVNPDPRESDLVPASQEQIADILPVELVSGEDDLKSWLTQSRGSTPIWPTLLLGALAVICLEGMLSNLLVRNRAQGDASHVHTGRLHRRRFGAVIHHAPEGVS